MKRGTWEALNKLAKWRALFAGWHLGTRSTGDQESEAMRDLQEARLMLRVEMTAVTSLLLSKGLITEEELEDAMALGATELDMALERRFPGVKSSQQGLELNPQEINRAGWMKGWPM